jgi:hypothetical protein
MPNAPAPPHRRRRDVAGTIYLLHFDAPFGHARHYGGFAEGDADGLAARLAQHGTPHGARLLLHVKAAGIGWRLVRTWRGTRATERRLKGWSWKERCPICTPSLCKRRQLRGSTLHHVTAAPPRPCPF